MKSCTIHQGCDIVVNHLRGQNFWGLVNEGKAEKERRLEKGVNMSIIYDWLLVYRPASDILSTFVNYIVISISSRFWYIVNYIVISS